MSQHRNVSQFASLDIAESRMKNTGNMKKVSKEFDDSRPEDQLCLLSLPF